MKLTEAQRQELLERAIAAVKARYAAGPDTDPAELGRLNELSRLAVTDAVTRGDHVHTLISHAAGVSGLRVIDLIADWSAQARALGVERHAAQRYVDQVRDAAVSHARRRAGSDPVHGVITQIAKEVGVGRRIVSEWIASGLAGDASPQAVDARIGGENEDDRA